jgi:hypothetical protein
MHLDLHLNLIQCLGEDDLEPSSSTPSTVPAYPRHRRALCRIVKLHAENAENRRLMDEYLAMTAHQ